MKEERTSVNIQEFWDSRAQLAYTSGSNDFILKDIETDEILKQIKNKPKIVLDVGCGNGETLIKIAKLKDCSGVGIDSSPKMVEVARQNAKNAGMDDKVVFEVGEVQNKDIGLDGFFDYVLTQRCLGNLTCVEDQIKAVENIMDNLKPNGVYIMVEDCIQGHNRLNEVRERVGLYPIDIYWYNLFLDEDEVAKWGNDKFFLELGPISVSSTHYFLSRVVYAKLEDDKGTKPEDLKYDSDINMLAYKIPNMGNLGAPTMWLWRKK